MDRQLLNTDGLAPFLSRFLPVVFSQFFALSFVKCSEQNSDWCNPVTVIHCANTTGLEKGNLIPKKKSAYAFKFVDKTMQ